MRPEGNLAVASVAGKARAFTDQTAADAEPTRGRLNQQQAQLGYGLRLLHKKNRAGDLAVFLGDPTAFPFRVIILDELGDNFSHEGFEALIPSILLRIEHTVAVHHPAHVAGLMRPKNVRRPGFRRGPRAQQALDGMHGSNQLALL